jgi:hypothetical protein
MRLKMDFATSTIEDDSAKVENKTEVPLMIYTKLLSYLDVYLKSLSSGC